ncbi:DUF2505 domain-containing protein [Millisia brevis]|uniref:DUF2505 domain-containing protein n=1 Tax=Millisia brevis TaxID=264148 RepID=UPI000830C723|nr:DUF2505 domain-containing protein [Millisia brevis]
MARRMSYSARLRFETGQVYEALQDTGYWEHRIEELRKYSPNEMVSLEVSDSGIDVELHHILPRTELPEIAQTVIKKDMVITRHVHFDPYTETTAGTYSASIPGGPGSLTGETSLFPTETGCTLRTTSTAKVFVPFVGPRLEQLMLVNLVDLFRAEGDLTAEWLTKKG